MFLIFVVKFRVPSTESCKNTNNKQTMESPGTCNLEESVTFIVYIPIYIYVE